MNPTDGMTFSTSGISVLCPTRGRPGLLAAAVRMLLHHAARPERVEILVMVDNDDPVDYEKVWLNFAPRGAPRVTGKLFTGPRKGYEKLCEYYNFLAKEASGRWCMLFNDDIFMATQNWDLILDGVPGKVAVAMTESNHGRSPCTFPIFTKSFADAIGHVSMSAHNDTWIEEVGKAAGITVDVPILMLHALIEDKTAHEGKAEGRIEKTSAAHYAPEMQRQRAADVAKIKAYLRGA